MSIYSIEVSASNGETFKLERYKGKVMMIVNTASECGLAPQLEGLEALYQKYKDQGLVVLGFPSNQFKQEPLENDELAGQCSLKYEVTFPVFNKIIVNGKDAHPLYKYLTANTGNKRIKWNYTKFLVDQEGNVVDRFGSITKPEKMEDQLIKLL
ncbi:MAG: glutathione peroxidase [Pisciglobus halotolerans]|nr:glutathione peroxidase [Pisciglobus halotolerans]